MVVWLYRRTAEGGRGFRPFGTAVKGEDLPPINLRKEERRAVRKACTAARRMVVEE